VSFTFKIDLGDGADGKVEDLPRYCRRKEQLRIHRGSLSLHLLRGLVSGV
jgi:hypothetical protein